MSVRRSSIPWVLVVVTIAGIAVFVALTILVTSGSSRSLDSRAFDIADHLRAPWLDNAARVVTTLGLIATVGSVIVVGGTILVRHRELARAAALMVGAALTWISVWIVKSVVNRPRPPDPLVHTTGQSYPSAHAANAVGWLALTLALTVVIPTRGGRIVAITGGALLAVCVGLSRIYLRAHYFSDVLAGEALAVAMYALAAIGAFAWRSSRAGNGGDATALSEPASRDRRQ
jgi:membrane-associated phospholipid phosphatase